MNRLIAIAACALMPYGAAFAATQAYDLSGFEGVEVSAGISADIRVGPGFGVVAETTASNFDDLRVSVQGGVLRAQPVSSHWFSGMQPGFRIHITMPALHSVEASSGADAKVEGNVAGDLALRASSSGDINVAGLQAGKVKARLSSGAGIRLAGTCAALTVRASSGADLKADGLRCETVELRTSSGSDVSVAASKSVTGHASSGSDVRIGGRPQLAQVTASHGADVVIVN